MSYEWETVEHLVHRVNTLAQIEVGEGKYYSRQSNILQRITSMVLAVVLGKI